MIHNISIKRIILCFVVFASLIPNIGIKLVTFGFTWTFYRFIIPLSLFICLSLRSTSKIKIRTQEHNNWIKMMVFWLLYGILIMFISSYRDFHNGFIELLSLFNGIVYLYLVGRLINKPCELKSAMSTIYVVYLFMIVLGVFEIKSGMHLPMSEFLDKKSPANYLSLRGATGTFYGMNDYSAFLTTALPILFYNKKFRIINLIAAIGVIYIDYQNDANICIIAILFGLVFYVFFLKQYRFKNVLTLRIMFFILFCIVLFCVWLYNTFPLMEVIKTQLNNFKKSEGSLWMRITIYIDSLKAAYNTFFIGVGPAAFMNYFIQHPSASGLINPHNMYLEILVEYGLVLFLLFVFSLFHIINKLCKIILNYNNKIERRVAVSICEMLIIYSIVCITSSSFIGYAWQWVIIGLGTICIKLTKTDKQSKQIITENKLIMDY